jgi:ribosomal 30S subunit maturation factor RimM
MTARRRVYVGKRALIQRINRALQYQGQKGLKLKVRRGDKWQSTIGEYYVVDIERNIIVNTNADLEELGRELKVLADYEHLVDEH